MLILARHAMTDMNDPRFEMVRGNADVPLNEEGKQEAEDLGKNISEAYDIDLIVCDGLKRTLETAEVVARHCNSCVVVDPNAGPWDVGTLAHQYKEEARPTLEYLADHYDTPVAGGETYRQFFDNTRQVLAHWQRAAEGMNICLIWHSSNFNAMPALMAGAKPYRTEGSEPPHGRFMVMD